LFVQRVSEPSAVGLFLIRLEPSESSLQLRLVAFHAGLLERQRDDAGGIAVAPGLEGCVVSSLPLSHEGREAAASVRLLFAQRFIRDGLLLCRSQKTRRLRRRPEQKYAINQFLRSAPVDQIGAEQVHILLDRRRRLIVTGRACRGNHGQHGPVIL